MYNVPNLVVKGILLNIYIAINGLTCQKKQFFKVDQMSLPCGPNIIQILKWSIK